MTDSDSPTAVQNARKRGSAKRERLVNAARDVIHRQGVEATTLADIASAADVPLGNVYYYFKTKDELVAAVVEAHAEIVRATLAEVGRSRSPKARLKAFIRMLADQGEETALYGCPQGTLCSELDKHQDPVCEGAGVLMTLPIDWAEQQFRELGRRDARELAVALIAAYQGAALLTNTLRDPRLMAGEARRLERWIDALA
jgi:TetR/AcrR family transcriptional regulator, transcriptional repressor for nem operon